MSYSHNHSTATIDPIKKIENFERYACDTSLSKADRACIISEMNLRTRVLLGERTSPNAVWCQKMWDLEGQYGLHANKKALPK